MRKQSSLGAIRSAASGRQIRWRKPRRLSSRLARCLRGDGRGWARRAWSRRAGTRRRGGQDRPGHRTAGDPTPFDEALPGKPAQLAADGEFPAAARPRIDPALGRSRAGARAGRRHRSRSRRGRDRVGRNRVGGLRQRASRARRAECAGKGRGQDQCPHHHRPPAPHKTQDPSAHARSRPVRQAASLGCSGSCRTGTAGAPPQSEWPGIDSPRITIVNGPSCA